MRLVAWGVLTPLYMEPLANADVHVTPELVARFDVPGPRYTSYPTADRFTTDFDADAAARALATANARRGDPIGLYVHLPYCPRICTYCACTVIATKNPARVSAYVDLVLAELAILARHLPDRRRLAQLHLGGGTPNHVPPADLDRLMRAVRATFEILPDAELAIEVDPRLVTTAQLEHLVGLGFSRISFGVQDVDAEVQHAIGRRQTLAMTENAVVGARQAGFQSVNMDLVYGLPAQTKESFAKTLDSLLALRPDRVALFAFAYLPWLKANQRGIDAAKLPDPETKIGFLLSARGALIAAGYQAIGMDHFALPHDTLATAGARGHLRRTFQGYTVMPPKLDTVAIGLSAIGDVGDAYLQNTKELDDYRAAILAGRLPIERGLALTPDDLARRFIIQRLTCDFALDAVELRARFGAELATDFPLELADLATLEAQGLVRVSPERVQVTPLGRLFVRAVAMPFDRYLRERPPQRPAYSRVV